MTTGLLQAKIETIQGHARFTDDPEPTVEVNGKKYTAPHILIATGGRPSVLSDNEVPGKTEFNTAVRSCTMSRPQANQPHSQFTLCSCFTGSVQACISAPTHRRNRDQKRLFTLQVQKKVRQYSHKTVEWSSVWRILACYPTQMPTVQHCWHQLVYLLIWILVSCFAKPAAAIYSIQLCSKVQPESI